MSDGFRKIAIGQVVSHIGSLASRLLARLVDRGDEYPNESHDFGLNEAPLEMNSEGDRTNGGQWTNLVAAYLVGPEFRGRYREELISLENDISIKDVKNFIRTRGGSQELSNLFRTRRRLLRVQEALSRFETGVTKWRDNERFDSRVTWLLPASVRARDAAFLVNALSATISGSSRSAISDLGEAAPDVDRWLPWLSLELVHKMRSMKAADLSFLRRVIIKAARDFDVPGDVFPWESEFSTNLSELPIHCLYQFEPTYRRALRTLNDLSKIKCLNVGHLAAFDPQAWNAVRTLDPSTWTGVARCLRDHGLQSHGA